MNVRVISANHTTATHPLFFTADFLSTVYNDDVSVGIRLSYFPYILDNPRLVASAGDGFMLRRMCSVPVYVQYNITTDVGWVRWGWGEGGLDLPQMRRLGCPRNSAEFRRNCTGNHFRIPRNAKMSLPWTPYAEVVFLYLSPSLLACKIIRQKWAFPSYTPSRCACTARAEF